MFVGIRKHLYIMQHELMKQIDGLMAKAWDDLKEAADKKDAASLNPLNGRMAELGKMKKISRLLSHALRK